MGKYKKNNQTNDEKDIESKEKVKIFAKKNGFGRVFYLGKYQGRDLYKALDAEPDKRKLQPIL